MWVVVLVAAALSMTLIVELVFFDFIYGNPHRTRSNAIAMMIIFPPILAVVALVGTVMVFALPQYLQARLLNALVRRFDDRARFGVLAALPLTALVTWFCYDYLTPSNMNLGINTPPDWVPYEHGITPQRYVAALAFQTPVTLFSFLYFEAGVRHRLKKGILLSALSMVVVGSGAWGYVKALQQHKLQHETTCCDHGYALRQPRQDHFSVEANGITPPPADRAGRA